MNYLNSYGYRVSYFNVFTKSNKIWQIWFSKSDISKGCHHETDFGKKLSKTIAQSNEISMDFTNLTKCERLPNWSIFWTDSKIWLNRVFTDWLFHTYTSSDILRHQWLSKKIHQYHPHFDTQVSAWENTAKTNLWCSRQKALTDVQGQDRPACMCMFMSRSPSKPKYAATIASFVIFTDVLWSNPTFFKDSSAHKKPPLKGNSTNWTLLGTNVWWI